MSKTRPFVLGGLGAAAAAAYAVLSAGGAHADTILIPGHADGDCVGYVQQLGDTNQVVPPGTTVDNLPGGVHCANYSAQMAGVGNDTITTEDSTNEGAAHAHDICVSLGPSGHCTYRAYSEGSISGAKAQNQSLSEGRTNTNLVTDGDAVGSTSILKSPWVNNPAVMPFVDPNNAPFSFNPNGVPVVAEPPNTERHYSSNDPFANGNQLNPNAMWSQAVDSHGHDVQDPAGATVWNGPNGEVNVETVEPHPFTDALQDNNGVDVPPPVNDFFQAVDPVDSNIPGAFGIPGAPAGPALPDLPGA